MDTDRLPSEFIFTFDGDAPGRRAALRAFEMEARFVSQTFVAVQADGLDPCDLRVKQGPAAVRDLVASRVPLFEFSIRDALSRYDLETNEGKLAALDDAAKVVAGIKEPGLRDRYAISLDRWLGMLDEQFVLDRVRAAAGGRAKRGPGQTVRTEQPSDAPRQRANGARGQPVQQAGYDPADPVVNVERQALKLAIQRPALCGPVFDNLQSSVFTAPAHAAVCELIASNGGVASARSSMEWAERLRAAAPNDNARGFVTRLAVEPIEVPGAAQEPDARFAEAVLARVEELAVSREIAGIKSRLQRMSPVEEASYNRTFGDLVALEARKKVLSDKAAGTL
jgi:DNA primase